MTKLIIITGTPGSGKTTLSKKLTEFFKTSNITYQFYDNNLLIKEYPILNQGTDEKKDCIIIDETKLTNVFEKILIKNKNTEFIIYDSHISHYIDNKIVNLCIVLNCEINELYKRLKTRGYDEEKINENIQSEIFQICLIEALEFNHNIIKINSTKKLTKKEFDKIIENLNTDKSEN